MHQDRCLLTTKDLTILEVMLDRCADRDSAFGRLLSRKIGNATAMFRDDIPVVVATLSSRVTYRINGSETDSRIISHDRMNASTGLFLPITTLTGLALLGLTEGQSIRIEDGNDVRQIRLDTVLYQPEAARRERELLARMATPEVRRGAFRVVTGGGNGES